MKALKILAILILTYAGVVAAFETWLGISQPTNSSSIAITTTVANGQQNKRILSRMLSDDRLYVSANHWPRAWYAEALNHPDVTVEMDGEVGNYRAIAVTGAEEDRVEAEHPHSLGFRILTGFPPRRFVRLDPVPAG